MQAVGKDAVPRATVPTMTRLMDELMTSLARCKQPKLRVLFAPWWRRHKQRFQDLFYDYEDIPIEAGVALVRYYESRQRLGQPVSTYPPGKVIFLRPIKTCRGVKHWDAVYIAPEDLVAEGILVSPTMLKDHLCSTVHDALQASLETLKGSEGRRGAFGRWPLKAVRGRWQALHGLKMRGQPPPRQSSLERSLVNAT